MVETFGRPPASIDLSPIAGLATGSPKQVYLFFLLSLCKNYFETMKSEHDLDIERSTAALVAFCPNSAKREELWGIYITNRDGGQGIVGASVFTVGALMDYLSEAMEFVETSSASVL